jgi:uncharacterized delta-60 repeat protein
MNRHQTFHAAVLAAAASITAGAHGVDVQQDWLDRLDGPASMNDYGEAVAIGDDGSVYVAGSIFEQVESNLFAPRFMTVRYDIDGTRLWERTYAGTFASGAAAALHIALDGDGNILVSGSTNQGDDWAVLKYDDAGAELWRRVYEADSTFLTQPDDMAVDAAGNVYLTGMVGSSVNPNSGTVVKYSSDGVQQWIEPYYGPTFDGAFFRAVAVDGAGNVYAAGGAAVPGRATELAVVQFDSDGNEQWLATDGAISQFAHDRATDIIVDGNGDIIVVGVFGGNTAAGLDIAVAKYDVEGNQLWRELYMGPDGRDDSATEVAVDGDNNIVVVGYSSVTFSDYDALTLKYDPSGELLWERRIAGDEDHFDRATGVAIDGQDNIYITGTYDPIGGSRYFAVRYAPDGSEQWFTDYAGPIGGGSRANDIAVGADGSVAVTGDSPDAGTDFDIATIRYEQSGEMTVGDLDGDGSVSVIDLLLLLDAWGACADCDDCPADLNGDCIVSVLDLLLMLDNWG